MKSMAVIATAAMYDAAFQAARAIEYPTVDAFEQRMGYAIDRSRLESAARVLACPLKTNPPHWQHGRVLYAAARNYWGSAWTGAGACLDIGTAKGFSALVLEWAGRDAGVPCLVRSVDVIDPNATVLRNTVAECDGPKTLAEILSPWPEAAEIGFEQATGVEYLHRWMFRWNIAFIDGKHSGSVVTQEGTLLAQRQEPGDLAIFDDCQIRDVSMAVESLREFYCFDSLTAGPREYAIGRRR